MPSIQETIMRAVKLMGPEILENTRNFSNILEDLAPELVDERKFIAKIYSDDVGKLVAGTYKADISVRKEGVREIDIFLDNENGINESWRKRFLEYFDALFDGNTYLNKEDVKSFVNTVNVDLSIINDTTKISKSSREETSKEIYEKAMQADQNGDYETAIKLLKMIRDGSEFEIKAKMYLGEYYEEEEPERAFVYYLRAGDLGDARAQFLVGYMYEYGEGVTQNIKLAVAWYTKAANGGNRGAQHNLGFFYYSGNGVKQDYKRAYEYFLMAARQGKADSMRNIGAMCELGQYVQRNLETALAWYKAAADNGDDNALKDYEDLKKALNKK